MLTHNVAGMGGSFMRSHSLARSLHERGHDVTLLASSSRRALRVRSQVLAGPRVVEFPDLASRRIRHGGLSPMDLVGRVVYGLRGRYDIVHGFDHRPVVSVPALALKARNDTYFVSDWADFWGRGGIADLRGRLASRTLGFFDHYWERWIRKWADGITCVSDNLELKARDLGVEEDRIRVIPAGSNIDVIRPMAKEAVRAKFGIDPESHVAVYIGQSAYDQQLLAESFLELVRLDPRALLLLTGRTLPLLAKLLSEAGFRGRVMHMGYPIYEALGEVLACGDVMLLPYTRIGANVARFPNRFGDYLAAGRPIVTNPTGDLGKIVRGERIGVVTEEDPKAFAEAVARLFRDRELRDELGIRARRLAETQFDWRILAGEVEHLYASLLSS